MKDAAEKQLRRRTGLLQAMPNVLTLFRLGLTVPFFYCLTQLPDLADMALALYLLACATDIVDGIIARKFGAQTVFGRLMDPAADKILVCGSFVFLVRDPVHVPAWVGVVILARELGVTALRAVAESQGRPYPGTIAGKVKMVIESAAICYIVFYAGHLQGLPDAAWAGVVMWVMIILTLLAVIGSGVLHVFFSLKLILWTR